MADQKHITKGMQQTQNAIEFINKSVLKPDVKPMKGTAAPMIDQATGMMVQDLQSFLKGFEQVGLVALARLANNILTYGTYYGPKPSDDSDIANNLSSPKGAAPAIPNQQAEQVGSDVMKGLFSVVGEYGKMKAEISSLIHSKHPKHDAENYDFNTKTAPITQPVTPAETVSSTMDNDTTHGHNDTHTEKVKHSKTKPIQKELPPSTDHYDSEVDAKKAHETTPDETQKSVSNEGENLVKSLKNIEDIFEPLLDNAEKLTEGISEVESEFEQAIENEMNDHDTNFDDDNDDDDDDNSDKKTYWFPRKK